MKAILGVVLLIAAVVGGLWAGLWWAFIGGIIQIVDALKGDLNALDIALGVVRILFAGAIGVISFWLLALPGIALIND